MKKLIASLMAAAMLFTIVPAAGGFIKKIDKGDVVFTTFYDSDYADLVDATKDLKAGDTLRLRIMSPGGPSIVCIAITNHILKLQQAGIHVITESEGLAASAGAVLWLAGDERIATTGDLFMFHHSVIRDNWGQVIPKESLPPTTRWIGDQIDYFMRQFLLNILRDTELVNSLMDDTGNIDGTTEENWFTAEEVYKMGLATKLIKTI